MAGFVLANGIMSSNQSGEGEIRKAIVEADLVDCMVAMPGQLFYSTPIPVCLWLASRRTKKVRPVLQAGRGRATARVRPFSSSARKLGTLIDRVHREGTDRRRPHRRSAARLPQLAGRKRRGELQGHRGLLQICHDAAEIACTRPTSSRPADTSAQRKSGRTMENPSRQKMPRLVAELHARVRVESAEFGAGHQSEARRGWVMMGD